MAGAEEGGSGEAQPAPYAAAEEGRRSRVGEEGPVLVAKLKDVGSGAGQVLKICGGGQIDVGAGVEGQPPLGGNLGKACPYVGGLTEAGGGVGEDRGQRPGKRQAGQHEGRGGVKRKGAEGGEGEGGEG